MGASFFTSEIDSELLSGSNHFSAKISADPAAFNLSQEQADAYAALNAAWSDAYRATAMIGTRTKGLVLAKNDARSRLRKMASDLSKIISGASAVTSEQRIDLGLSVRKKPSPLGPPGTPSEFTITLTALGSIELNWKCKHPKGATGMTYQIFRRVGDAAEPVYVGSSGVKRFVDNTIPTGATVLTYRVRAIRSTATGAWAEYNVTFGGTQRAPTFAAIPMNRAA